jgi:hypothetical protein
MGGALQLVGFHMKSGRSGKCWDGGRLAICLTVATLEMAKSHSARMSRSRGPDNRWKRFLAAMSHATQSPEVDPARGALWQ